jgi:dGTPase
MAGKKFSDLESEMAHKKSGDPVRLIPMSMEGCVVRFSDTVSYIGRDIEDAIRLGLIHRSELPAESVSRLGDTNGKIVYSLVTDIILNSYKEPYVSFSPEVSDALKRLKKFNYDRIYMNPVIKKELSKIEQLFNELFARFLGDISEKKRSSPVFKNFINGMSDDYMAAHCPAEIVRDFIAGMTDQYFLRQFPEVLRPRPIRL